MKEIIAIVSRKGGTAKTTTAGSLGAALRRSGARVLLIDLDAQRNLSAAMGAAMTGPNVTHLLEGSKPENVIQHTRNGDIITGSAFLAAADLAMNTDTELKHAIAPLLPEYDYIVLDTPASYGRLTRNALAAATAAIITAQAATFSAQGLEEIAGIINQMKAINKGLKLRGIIVTNYAGRSNRVKALLEELRQQAAALGSSVLEPPIKATDKVIEAQAAQVNLIDYAPKSTAAQCYIEIADTILNWQ